MPNRVTVRANVAAVAARLVRPEVEQIVADIRDGAAERAPDGKVWVTQEDERVRYAHGWAHEQTVPGNLQYQLPAMRYVRGVGEAREGDRYDLAWEPRDEQLPDNQRYNCRCQSVPLPGAVAASFRAGPVRVEGGRVSGEVSSTFPRVAESEFERDGGGFLRGAAEAVAARLGRARR